MNRKPIISVVTVVYNGSGIIEDTIKSVLNQTYERIEYIIIDGNSNDGTIDIIKKFDSSIQTIVSEPDKGIFDAMNKGLSKATGEWIIFMNAGDMFFNDQIVSEIFDRPLGQDVELIYGNVSLFDEDDVYEVSIKTNRIKINLNALCHQSVFIRRRLHPNFDLSYKLSADHNLIYDFVKRGKCKYVDLVVSRILMGGVSSDLPATRREKFRISMQKGKVDDKVWAYIFYGYGAMKDYTKRALLYVFPESLFHKIRSLKNRIEQS
ncbi:putative glycosyltransferase [Pedobacter sp. BAL39]|uniref:glycosyltransferase family 2 protein n=1 Tax=Pedobacter sp. BAL39 TaxID=391596 RepID=UPI000155970E|nr:glycosyltransferase family 2 protein [Pedobacter sp. BAL39]EDM37182.1 putative glycosyltransferase [Pedobacter sp. BAL39]